MRRYYFDVTVLNDSFFTTLIRTPVHCPIILARLSLKMHCFTAVLALALSSGEGNHLDPARPGYHYTRPYGWQNDPVPFYDKRTRSFHLFPLCDPNATTQWRLPSDHSAWCHASSDDGFQSMVTHQPALMKGPWPGEKGVGGTGNIVELPPADQKRLNATTAAITGGAFMWLTSDVNLQEFRPAGGLLAKGPDGPASPSSPAPNVRMCGDVHVYYVQERSIWRIIMAGSDNNCNNASRTETRPLALIYEAPYLQFGKFQIFVTLAYLFIGLFVYRGMAV